MTSHAHHSARKQSLAGLVLLLATSVILAACGSADSTSSPAPDYSSAIKNAPPKLAALYASGDALIEGGQQGYDSTLASVKGYPVVVNNWGSWCGPCREEFPHFQSQAAEHLDEVAFLGVDTEDAPEAYRTFLRDNPIPYPSVADPDRELSSWSDTSLAGQPNTLYYDRSGQLVYVHQGPYASEGDLAADIDKYALSS